jgi:predicted GNAT family acetyltransferase
MTIGLALAGLAALYAAKQLGAVVDTKGCKLLGRHHLGPTDYSFWLCEDASWSSVGDKSESGMNAIATYADGHEAAYARAVPDSDLFYEITSSYTKDGHQQRGLAKKLYNSLRVAACEKGKSLTSDTHRSTYSEMLWRNQVAKGAAVCEEGSGIALGPFDKVGLPVPRRYQGSMPRWPCLRYVSSCEKQIEGLASKPYVIRKGKKVAKLPWYDCQKAAGDKYLPEINAILRKHGLLQETRKANPDWNKAQAMWKAMPAADKKRHDSLMRQWGRAIQRCIDAARQPA